MTHHTSPEISSHLETLELPPLQQGLIQQIENYIHTVDVLAKQRGDLRTDAERNRDLAMLQFKLTQFVYSRDARADDIASQEVQDAIKLKSSMLPFGIPKLMICVDGRVLSKLFAGLHGSALRTPAGDTVEFLPKQSGVGLFLRHGSLTAMMGRVFEHQNAVCEILDSHVGCAARAGEAAKKHGAECADKGLRDDVLRKKDMCAALKEYVAATYHDAKQILPIQTSFDPHSGYCMMGLEKDECVNDPRVMADGFTHDHLDALIAEQKIVSTEHLVESDVSPLIRETFTSYYFPVNYETNYRESSALFWKNIHAMSDKIVPLIKQHLQKVFPHLSEGKNINELTQRAVILLANAYNAYLHHHDASGATREYPYGEHDESVIAVTISEKGPYDRARSFSVDPLNPNLSGVIDFTANLIRGNRRAGRMSETERHAVSKLYQNAADYVGKSVPAILFERTNQSIADDLITAIQETNWSDLSETPWMTMTDDEFEEYLNKKITNIPAVIARKINELRKRAIKLYTPGQPATDSLLDGRIVPIWSLAGPDRKTIALFPFVANGYTK